MRVVVTGHQGYIGATLVPLLKQAGHKVIGIDTKFYDGCALGPPPCHADVELHKDIREVDLADFDGADAVIHLAALSNDPLGNLNGDVTFDINHRASVRLAERAKRAGVPRFLYSSSCSTYGAAHPLHALDESAAFNPVTPYAESKVLAERELAELSDGDFCPVYLRNATAYGFSPQFRADLVVNSLVGNAYLTGTILIKSDGTPWRPLIHVEDIGRAFLAMLSAPREKVCNQAFNIGRNEENYQVRDVAQMVQAAIPGSKVQYAADAGPDKRCYRVKFDKARKTLPDFAPKWTVACGIDQLARAFRDHGLERRDFDGPRFLRIERIKNLLSTSYLDDSLRWKRRLAPH
jgi:nucleoside-diphosphate-sugar epimerase